MAIESMMYMGLGFLLAALITVLAIPLVHSRAERLTIRRLEASLPQSPAEVHADKDLLRAEHAISTRRLELKIEHLTFKLAGQLVELGKKQDAVSTLKRAAPRGRAFCFRPVPVTELWSIFMHATRRALPPVLCMARSTNSCPTTPI